jgi:hypothetical protein
MRALLDGDIFSYEIGFGSQVGWGKEGETPPFSYAEGLLLRRIDEILIATGANSYQIYLSGDNNFRFDIAKQRPYKGTRKKDKPFHYKNLRAYMEGVLDAIITDGIEADDAMAIEQTLNESVFHSMVLSGKSEGCSRTIICTRDKDLRMVPGMHYGWEVGKQPSYGPKLITKEEGDRNFFMQCLTGDVVDNISGIPKCGPVKALSILANTKTYPEMLEAVRDAYRAFYGDLGDERLLEQGQLLWMIRELDEEGKPVMWSF